MAYATAEDLRRFLRVSAAFTADEEAQAELLIELAQGTIEEETGQALESATDTVELDGSSAENWPVESGSGPRKLVLPRWPVTAVTSVTLTEDGDVLTEGTDQDYTWSRSGVLTRRGACWPTHDRAVEVVYTAGFVVLPTGVKRICLRLAAAAWGNPEGLTAESLGDHSRSFSAEALGMELSATDRRALTAYKART